MDLGLQDKVVLITGASGGIGEETARVFSREGAKVVIHYGRNEKAARALQAELETESIIISANISDEEAVANLFSQAIDKFGRIDTLVANAGIFPADDVPIHKMDKERWDKVIEVNLTGGLFLVVREYFRWLDKARPRNASVVLISSTSGIFGEYGHLAYSMSKAGLLLARLTLKNEIVKLVPAGRVNVVAPGWTWTPMTEQFKTAHEAVTTALQTRPLPDIARPIDIANQIVVMASDKASRQVTGKVISVDGGMEGRIVHTPDEIDPTKA